MADELVVDDGEASFLVLSEEGAELNDPRWADGPRPRTWRELLNGKFDFDHLNVQRRREVMEEWTLDDSALSKESDFEVLLDWYPEETPTRSVYRALEFLREDPRAEGLLEFVDYGSPGSDYVGVKAAGSLFAMDDLLRECGVPYRIEPNFLWDELESEVESVPAVEVLRSARDSGASPQEYRDVTSFELEMLALDRNRVEANVDSTTEEPVVVGVSMSAGQRQQAAIETLDSFEAIIRRWAELAANAPEQRVLATIARLATINDVSAFLRRYVREHGALPAGEHSVSIARRDGASTRMVDFDRIAKMAEEPERTEHGEH